MIRFLDTTFREGRQSHLGYLLSGNLHRYFIQLEKMGINYIEISNPFLSTSLLEEFKSIINRNSTMSVAVHSPLDLDFLKKLLDINIKCFHFSIKQSDKPNNIETTCSNINIGEITQYLSDNNIDDVSLKIGLENAFSVEYNVLSSFFHTILSRNQIDKISLSDSNGSTHPDQILDTLRKLDKEISMSIAIGIHLHNDTGLAAMTFNNIYNFFKNSKREIIVDISMGGIGERNGILSYGDVMALLYKEDNKRYLKNFNFQEYKKIYLLLFSRTSFNRDPINPYAFSHSSGLHINQSLNTPMGNKNNLNNRYLPFKSEDFGFKTKYVYNETLNKETIISIAINELKISLQPNIALQVCQDLRNIVASKKRNLTIGTIKSIILKYNNQ